MKFDMGAQTLSQLGSRTSSAGQDLSTLVHRLADAAAPLENKFNGAGRAQFDQFKARTDDIANNLASALSAVLTGIQGQDKAFQQGQSDQASASSQMQSSIDFDAAKFSGH